MNDKKYSIFSSLSEYNILKTIIHDNLSNRELSELKNLHLGKQN